MAPMAVPSQGIPLGMPMAAHDLSDTARDGFYSIGANPPPAWSNYVGPAHKSPTPVATQLVVPTQLSSAPVDLTCVHCQHHVRTNIKTSPSTLSWALCVCMCVGLCWPCAPIPFCMTRFNVTEHKCSNCGKLLGKYKGWKGRAGP
eukprot:TRINITY_DN11613_c0_g1_i1.p1 TRINITY_DN11613_c0_g1~~TRINITY_DN11613_c0_g1_i1.p1  ORF type:complete len:145 (-),score=17.63 TRINITY_DN11613_c0_g1_i1:144-578(-)